MMRRFVVVPLVVALLAPAARAATWEIDPAHTSVEFSIRHMTVSNVRGTFDKVAGTVTSDETDLAKSTITATIETASVDTRNDKRDEHLRSADFFDVTKYPTMTFASKKIAKGTAAGHWDVTGDLTLHGVTKQVVLDVEGPTASVKDPMGNTRAGAHATTTIKRQDFGIVYSKTLETGGLMLGDDVTVTIDVEAVQK